MLWVMGTQAEGDCGTHVSQEAAADPAQLFGTGLKRWEEGEEVEIMELLQVAEDAATLAPEALGHVGPLQLGDVVRRDVAQRAHVLPLRGQQLLRDPLQLPVPHTVHKLPRWFATLRKYTQIMCACR